MTGPTLRRAWPAILLGVPALVLTACHGDAQPPQRTPDARPSLAPGVAADPLVWLQAGSSGGVPARQVGSARVTVRTVSLSGGKVEAVPSTDPGIGGDALRFPAFTKDATYPRAVVTVTDSSAAGAAASLDPGDDDFSWGADFRVDQESTDRTDDNGNNIVQRGISSFPALFKVEIDYNEQPTCTARGDRGTVIVRSREAILPGTWARVRCTRRGDRLEVAVGEVLADGTAAMVRRQATGPIGAIEQSDPSVPLSVGGKIGSDGQVLASASDQFNGEIVNPYLQITR